MIKKKYLWVAILALFLLISPSLAKTIDFKEIYQDYNGTWYKYTSSNLSDHPLYNVTLNGTNYTISRMGTSINIPIRVWINYNFYPDRIQPIFTIQNFTQINNLVVKVNSTTWYLTFPWSASQVKNVTGTLIDMGIFRRTLDFTVINSTNKTNLSYVIIPKVISGDIRLYFNPQNFTNFSYPMTIIENTIVVNNATTQGFTSANVSLNGSRWTNDGSLAIGYIHNNTDSESGCWNFDETTGTILHNCNNADGTINTTNQGTWHGNPSLNFTSNSKIGNAGLFDGANDYVGLGTDESLDCRVSSCSIIAWFKTTSTSQVDIVERYNSDTGVGFRMYVQDSEYLKARVSDGTHTTSLVDWAHIINDNQWHQSALIINRTDNYSYLILDGKQVDKQSISTVNNISESTYEFNIGSMQGVAFFFSGSIDEVEFYNNRALNNSEITTLYNTSMRTQATPTLLNQSASAGNNIVNISVNFVGGDSLNNISIYGNKSGIAGRTLIQNNITSGTTYNIDSSLINNTMDFGFLQQGNGSNTTFIQSITLGELPIITPSLLLPEQITVSVI